MNPTAYVFECETYCDGCEPDGAEPVFFGESDCPLHCAKCEELLPYSMTTEGYAYVADRIMEWVENPKKGRAEILMRWWSEYGADIPKDAWDSDTLGNLLEALFRSRQEVARS